jgi:ribosomal protein L37AE/L43A
MAPRARTAPVARFKPPIGATVNRRLELAVWFCENCGIKRPRFG